MSARSFLGILCAAYTVACAQIPDLSFAPVDASVADSPPPAVDGAAPESDGAAVSDGAASTTGDADDGATASDAIAAADVSPPMSDAGLACLPKGAPPGTLCCQNGTPCIGPACSSCNSCNCATGLYCCATETASGKVKGVNCSSAPTGPTCPAQ